MLKLVKNFVKILNDIAKINNDLINIIFQNDNEINYVLFICQLIDKFITKEIINKIEQLYNNLNITCLKFCGKNININFVLQYSSCGKLFIWGSKFKTYNKKLLPTLISV